MSSPDQTPISLPPPGPLQEAHAFFEQLVTLEQTAQRMMISSEGINIFAVRRQIRKLTNGLDLFGDSVHNVEPPKDIAAALAKIHKRHIFAVLSYEHERYGTVFRAYVGHNKQVNDVDIRMEYEESWYAIRASGGAPDPAGELVGIGRDRTCSACWGAALLRDGPCVDEHGRPGACRAWGGWGWAHYSGWSMRHDDIDKGVRMIPTTRRKSAQNFRKLLGEPTARHGVCPTASLWKQDGEWVRYEYPHRAAWRLEFGGGEDAQG